MTEQVGPRTMTWEGKVEAFRSHLRTAVASFLDPRRNDDTGNELIVRYGNLRSQEFGSEGVTSIALIYETPPGSTNQIQIRCEEAEQRFIIPDRDAETDVAIRDLDEAIRLVDLHIQDVPRQRACRIRDYIESWLEAGKDLAAVLEELNAMLHQEMRGGRITYDELAEACRYAHDRLSGRLSR